MAYMGWAREGHTGCEATEMGFNDISDGEITHEALDVWW